MLNTEANSVLINLSRTIQKYHQNKIVIIGIGNILKGDDGFGPALIGRLKGRIKPTCLDVGSTPENYLGLITKEKPDLILLLDAVSSSDNLPGEIFLYNSNQICCLSSISTHSASLNLFINLVSQYLSAEIYLIGLQPLSLDFETVLSLPAQEAVSKLEKLFIEILSQR